MRENLCEVRTNFVKWEMYSVGEELRGEMKGSMDEVNLNYGLKTKEWEKAREKLEKKKMEGKEIWNK